MPSNDTDLRGLLIGQASMEARIVSMDARLTVHGERIDEKLENLEERMDERHDHLRELLAATVKGAINEAIEEHFQPLEERVETLEKDQLERKTVLSTSIKGATAVGGGLSILWGAVLALLELYGK